MRARPHGRRVVWKKTRGFRGSRSNTDNRWIIFPRPSSLIFLPQVLAPHPRTYPYSLLSLHHHSNPSISPHLFLPQPLLLPSLFLHHPLTQRCLHDLGGPRCGCSEGETIRTIFGLAAEFGTSVECGLCCLLYCVGAIRRGESAFPVGSF